MHLQISHIAHLGVALLCLQRCGTHQCKERLRLPTLTSRRTLLACSETCVVRKLCLLVVARTLRKGWRVILRDKSALVTVAQVRLVF